MAEHLDSTNLVPFKRRRRNVYHLPDLRGEQEEQIVEEVDPTLRPDEQGYVRHYLSYADILLKGSEEMNRDSEHFKGASERRKVTDISESNGIRSKHSKNNAA